MIRAIFFLLGISFSGAIDAASTIEISKPWARATQPKQKNGSVYLELKSLKDVNLIKASSPAAQKVELHTHIVDEQGVAKMREVKAIQCKAGEIVALKPQADHIMLMGLHAPLVKGSTISVSLEFDNGEKQDITVLVKSTKAKCAACKLE